MPNLVLNVKRNYGGLTVAGVPVQLASVVQSVEVNRGGNVEMVPRTLFPLPQTVTIQVDDLARAKADVATYGPDVVEIGPSNA